MITIQKINSTDIAIKLLYGLSIIHVILMILAAFNPSVWLDEVYTLSMIELPYNKLWEVVMIDVHPPLYFFYVKAVSDALSATSAFTFVSAAKIASILPIVALIIAAFLKVGRNWGKLCGAVFAFCITAMPQMLLYATEIRMYSLGMLFVTMSFLYAYDAAIRPAAKNFILLTVFLTLSLYTHYFACVSAAFVYMALALWFLRKDRKSLIKLLVSGIGTGILYLPWLATALKAFRSVSEEFWIESITLKSLLTYVYFPVAVAWQPLAALLLCIVLLIVFLRFIAIIRSGNRNFTLQEYFVLSGVAVVIATVFVGILVSLLIRPVFTARYMFPALGCFWLAFAAMLSYESPGTAIKNRPYLYGAKNFLLCAVLIAGLGNSLFSFGAEINRYNNYEATIELFNEIEDNDSVISDSLHIAGMSSYLTEAKTVYSFEISPSQMELFRRFFPNVTPIYDINSIKDIQDKHKKVWVMYTNQTDLDKVTQYLNSNGISFTSPLEYSFESYTIKVIQLAS